jgi:ferric-dicitrate binding protein FerR (iron transport regulator)
MNHCKRVTLERVTTDQTQRDGSMTSEHSTIVRIDQEAAEWLVQIKDMEAWLADRTLPESFLSWLSQSQRHGAAFFNAACTWRKLDAFSKPQRGVRPEQATGKVLR